MDRKYLIAGLVILVITFLLFLNFSGPERQSKTVTRVIDGDTVVLEGGERVRLLDIDSQEEGEECYDDAKSRLEELILKKEVGIESRGEGSYGRELGYIFLNGTLINAKLVREGLAVAYIYEEGGYSDKIREAEQDAMESNRGCEW